MMNEQFISVIMAALSVYVKYREKQAICAIVIIITFSTVPALPA